MNFYAHHIGDYLTATAHLSWVEDCAYRRLLDLYYSREQPIPADVVQAARLCRATTKDERKAVESVLSEFFTLTEKGWTHSRCEEEIIKAGEAAERARQNGKRGGRPPKQKPADNPAKTQPVSGVNPEESKSKAPNPNPITNTSYSEANASDAGASDENAKRVLWQQGVALLCDQGMADQQARSYIGKLAKDYPDGDVVRDAVRAAVVEQPADAKAYLKATCQHLAGQRKREQPLTFAQQDELARRRRWEESTGRKWPESGDVIDVEATQPRIEA